MITIPRLLSEYETNIYKDRLSSLPVAIRKQKDELADAKRSLAEAQNAKTEVEAMLTALIAAEVNPETGKPRFTNAQMRSAELVHRQKESTEYQAAKKECDRAEAFASSMQFNLEQLWDEFRACRYTVALITQELALWCSSTPQAENASEINREKQPF